MASSILKASNGMRTVFQKGPDIAKNTNIFHTPGVPAIQVAFLKHTAGEKYPYVPPFPYEKRRLTCIENNYDNTIHRFGEQSKIITIEGSIGLGKHAFAKRLAQEFDLLYVPGLQSTDLHVKHENGFNLRDLNDAMYDKENKLQDFRDLYTEDIDKGRAMRTQFECLKQRCLIYGNQCMLHLFSTGQGVVTVRSPYTEPVFVKTMADMGWINPRYAKWHKKKLREGAASTPLPHLQIYLDAPVEVVKENIAKRLEQDPNYQVGPHITDKFLRTLEKNYKEWLNEQRALSEVFEIDWTEPADETELDYIWEAIASLSLEPEDRESMRFRPWIGITEDLCWRVRNTCSRPNYLLRPLERGTPTDVPEFMVHHEALEERDDVYRLHPMARFNFTDENAGFWKTYFGIPQAWRPWH